MFFEKIAYEKFLCMLNTDTLKGMLVLNQQIMIIYHPDNEQQQHRWRIIGRAVSDSNKWERSDEKFRIFFAIKALTCFKLKFSNESIIVNLNEIIGKLKNPNNVAMVLFKHKIIKTQNKFPQ